MIINLSNTDEKAFVDIEDYHRVVQITWRLKHASGGRKYVATSIYVDGKTKTVYLHRLIMNPDSNQDVHHKDRNTRNNYRTNLQVTNSIPHRKYHLEECRSTS